MKREEKDKSIHNIKAKVAYFPLDNITNASIANRVDCMKKAGYDVVDFPRSLKQIHDLDDVSIVNLNWFESAEGRMNLLSRIALIYYLKLKGIKIVYTCHNKHPHDTKYKMLSKMIIKLLCKHSEAIIGLCSETEKVLTAYIKYDVLHKKYYTVPHVTYEGAYPESSVNFRKELGIDENTFVILSIGAVRPYKNIEMIIDVANECSNKITYIIAGSSSNKDYINTLYEKIRDKANIIPLFRFIADDEMAALVKSANILLLPYSTESSLNSGTAIMSMTLGRTFICPNIGTLKDIRDKSLFFSYEYHDPVEHQKILKEKVEEVYALHCKNPETIEDMGNRCAEYINEFHSKKIISEYYAKIYDSLL